MRMEMRKGFSGAWGAASTNKVLGVPARGSVLMWNLGLGHVCTSVLGKQGRYACGLAVRSLKPKAPRVTHRLGLNKNKTMVVSDAGRHPKTLLVIRYASVRHANPHIYNTWLYPNWKCEGILTKKQRHFCILDNHSHILVRGLPQEKMTWP